MVELTDNDVTFFVSSSTPVAKLGSAIAHGVYANRNVTLRAIGAGAVSQAMKAVAAAIGYAAPRGYDLVVRPSFADVKFEDKVSTAIVLQVIVLRSSSR